MRTTLTIDDDIAGCLERERQAKGLSFKEVVNVTLRRGLAVEQASSIPSHTIRVRPHDFGFKSGMDLNKLNPLVDELEAEAFLEKHTKSQTAS